MQKLKCQKLLFTVNFTNLFVHISMQYLYQIYGVPKDWTISRIKEIVLLVIRYAFWYLFVELWLHFIYTSALKHETVLLGRMDMWTLAGIGYRYVSLLIQKFTKRWRSHERQLRLLFLVHVGPYLRGVTRVRKHSCTTCWPNYALN